MLLILGTVRELVSLKNGHVVVTRLSEFILGSLKCI